MAGDIITAAGSKIYISNAAVASTVDTLAEWEATSVWTEIGAVESLGEFGDEANIVTGANLSDARMQKAKGVRDAGTIALVCFHDPFDAGQLALEAAEQTDDNYGFKIVLSDGQGLYSNSIYYFRALVGGRRLNAGSNENIMRHTYNLGINSAIVADPSST